MADPDLEPEWGGARSITDTCNCVTHHILDKTSTGKLDFMKKSLALGP